MTQYITKTEEMDVIEWDGKYYVGTDEFIHLSDGIIWSDTPLIAQRFCPVSDPITSSYAPNNNSNPQDCLPSDRKLPNGARFLRVTFTDTAMWNEDPRIKRLLKRFW